VDPDFTTEYPEADALSTECFATLCRLGDILWAELEDRVQATLGINNTVALALAVIDGEPSPLTPGAINERMVICASTITGTLDALEQRGWARRVPKANDRRSVLVEITPDGRAVADVLLPGVHAAERDAMAALSEGERRQLNRLLAKILAGLATRPVDRPTGLPTASRVRRIDPA
jgi:DNA-binding MarR family transcriptional regulator